MAVAEHAGCTDGHRSVRTGTTAMAMLLNVKAVRTGTAMAVAEHAGCTDGHRYGCC